MTEPFGTLIIDPPWPYDRSSDHDALTGYADKQYETLSIAELQSLPIGELVSGYIFLWTAGPFIAEGLKLLESWGFVYKTQLVWHKTSGLGVGYWFRGDHELVLLAKKPDRESIRTNERSLFKCERLPHSMKPNFIHELAERHFPGPYLEVFGRRSRTGWTVLGDEAPGDGRDIRESLALLLQAPVAIEFNKRNSEQGGLF